jgi:hypothetical protein
MLAHKKFMNWDGLMACNAKRTALLGAAKKTAPWVAGWNTTITLIQQYSQLLAANPIKLPKHKSAAGLSHPT